MNENYQTQCTEFLKEKLDRNDRLNIQLGKAQTALFQIADIVLPLPYLKVEPTAEEYTWDDVVKAVRELSEDAWKYRDLCR